MSTSQELFYPVLERRKDHKKIKGKYYSDYHEYYAEIETDCQKRCVYCDIQLEEMGGEGMQLDHFRPKSIPEFEPLKNDPSNLVLSCPKCNRLKSGHWPANPSTDSTCENNCGFIDPFIEDRKDYFEIENAGTIKGKQHPSEYMIRLLKLDRIAKMQVRRKRILIAEISCLAGRISREMEKIMDMFDSSSVTKDVIKLQFKNLQESFLLLKTML